VTTASNSFAVQDTSPDAINWVLACVRAHWGLNVAYSDTLTGPYAADRDTGTIWLPNGLPWRQAHAAIDRALLYMLGGCQWAREFAPPPVMITPSAKVLPLIRRVW
jgi:hypothetical protein